MKDLYLLVLSTTEFEFRSRKWVTSLFSVTFKKEPSKSFFFLSLMSIASPSILSLANCSEEISCLVISSDISSKEKVNAFCLSGFWSSLAITNSDFFSSSKISLKYLFSFSCIFSQ